MQYMYKFGLLTENDIIGWHTTNKSIPENEYFAGLVLSLLIVVQPVRERNGGVPERSGLGIIRRGGGG